MQNFVYLAIGGILGTISRYLLTAWLQHTAIQQGGPDAFPFGTMGVNLIGCLIIGLVMGFWEGRAQGAMPEPLKLMVVVGYLGALTTFSSFEMETVSLVQRGHWLPALGYVVSSTTLGFTAVWLAFSWAVWFFSPARWN